MKKIFTIMILALSINAIAQTVCVNDTIIPMANMPSHFNDMRTVSYNGEVYMFGGSNNTNQVDTTYKYNPITNTWSQLASMPTARGEIGAAEVNGTVYCIGGWSGSPSNLNEAYTISSNSWSTMANTPAALTACYAVSLNNKIYVIGGTLGITATSFYRYDPTTDTYTALATPSQNRQHARLVVYNNKIYYVGGQYYNGTYGTSNHLDEYDPLTNAWTAKAPIPASLQLPATAIYDSKLYLFGGSTTVVPPIALNTHYIYDFGLDSWTTMPTLPFTIFGMDGTTNNSKIYLFGGTTPALQSSNLCYKYFCLDNFCTQTIYDTIHIAVTDTLIINALLTGINAPNNLNTIKIYPNPTNTNINIDYGNYISMSGYTLKITNSLSQIVYSALINAQQTNVNLSTWTGNGIYFVHLIDASNNTIDIKKIVLQ